MFLKLSKISFLSELFINGAFIILYFLPFFNGLKDWGNSEVHQIGIKVGMVVIPIVLTFSVIAYFMLYRNLDKFFRQHVVSLLILIAVIIAWRPEFSFWLAFAHLGRTLFVFYFGQNGELKGRALNFSLFKKIHLRPAQMVLFSFSGVIFLGTCLLTLPISTLEGKSLPLIDALFMATSATCVTGLATVSLVNDLSIFGQFVILLLIQVGGLSIMTLYASLSILLGKNVGMKDRVVMQGVFDINSLEDLYQVVVDIIKYTFFIELVGALVLTLAFAFEDIELGQALYYGFFHSISAFCNAGFSLFSSNLESYATKPLIHGTISLLIILGGIGFIVLKELREVLVEGKKFVRLGIHTKIVLTVSSALILSGSLFIFFGEFLHALDKYTLWEKIQISLFQSITLRTAGFNTIPLSHLQTYTLYFMTLFMFIGGSPGSTAGGVKTTTLAILIQSIRATLKGNKSVNIFDRKVPTLVVVKVTAIMFISILITSFFILLLVYLEPNQSFLTLFFEAISASGTVGLSLGITPFLSIAGKWALALLMFSGRIGPLTLVLAIGQRDKSIGKIDYPDGRIMIG